MILIIHNNRFVVEVLDKNFQSVTNIKSGQPITKTILQIVNLFPNDLLLWCDSIYKDEFDVSKLSSVFHHKRILATYNPSSIEYLPKQIGYIDRTYYLKIKKNVTYPTWLMSGIVGGIHAEVIQNLKADLNFEQGFEYFLNSLAKRAMDEGLFCYSEPKLLKNKTSLKKEIDQASTTQLFQFVKQHYKWVWVFMLSLCYLVYEKKNTFLPLIKALFCNKRSSGFNLEAIKIKSTRKIINKNKIDVIIPTIGRKKYLYDVLKDLSKQTLLPINVIIIEQNPKKDSITELDYLLIEKWPFNIKHHFIHQIGVCNARNLGITQVESDWVFLGDDDNRFEPSLLENLFKEITLTGNKVGTTVYIQPHEKQTFFKTAQTPIFGAGNSMIKSSLLQKVKFNTKFEFNYGEDTEFGMQLRYLGEDVVFYSNIKITHLKAPIGGYRTKVKQLWDDDKIQPKPSPTIFLLKETYFTKKQLKGYKLLLFLKFYKNQTIKNPFQYFSYFKQQWQRSMYWSAILKNQL